MSFVVAEIDGAPGPTPSLGAYGTASIAITVEGTVVSTTPGSDGYITSVVCGGNAQGFFQVKINGTPIAAARNAWTQRTVTIELGQLMFSSGDVLSVTSTNLGKLTAAYEARINAFEC